MKRMPIIFLNDIKEYEEEHGEIPTHSWILIYTGWAKYKVGRHIRAIIKNVKSKTR